MRCVRVKYSMKIRWCHHYYCHHHNCYDHVCLPHPHQCFCDIHAIARTYTLKSNSSKPSSGIHSRTVLHASCSVGCINFIALWLPAGFGHWEDQQETGELEEKEIRVFFFSSITFSVSFSWVSLVWLSLCNKEHNTVCTCTSSWPTRWSSSADIDFSNLSNYSDPLFL